MMGKHTEGPWAVDTGMEVHKDGVTIFAWPEYSGTPDEEILANMALGAAAPELLEALENLLAECPEAWSRHGAQAAIAKARGEA